jgi:hypothetical protein
MSAPECTLTNLELADKVGEWGCKLASSRGQAWVLSIPPRHNVDPDLLMVEIAARLRKQERRIAELEALARQWIWDEEHRQQSTPEPEACRICSPNVDGVCTICGKDHFAEMKPEVCEWVEVDPPKRLSRMIKGCNGLLAWGAVISGQTCPNCFLPIKIRAGGSHV